VRAERAAKARLEAVRASKHWASARRFLAPLGRAAERAARAAVRLRRRYERLAEVNPDLFRGLLAEVVLAEQEAARAIRWETLAYVRMEWFARAEAAKELVAALRKANIPTLDDNTPRPPGPGRFEIQSEVGGLRTLDEARDALFRMGEILQRIVAKYRPLRPSEPDGSLRGRVRFEERIDAASTEAQAYIASVRRRLRDFYLTGFRRRYGGALAQSRLDRAVRRLDSGRMVPQWFDVRDVGAATLRAMGDLDRAADRNLAVEAVKMQVLLGRFRRKRVGKGGRYAAIGSQPSLGGFRP
jgi:hypothetical protein